MRLHRSEARWGEDRTDEDRSGSAWSPHSYVNISYLQECYESRVLSRHRSAQIRAIAILIHKSQFAYEWPRGSRGCRGYRDLAPTAGPRDRRGAAVCPTLCRGRRVETASRTVSC